MKRFLILFTLLSCITGISAQPAKRRTTTTATGSQTAKKAAAEKKVDRATLMFPTSAEMPEDVVWRRDIYRQLDLLKDANAPLYYPVEPHGKEQNLFTYLFRLFVSGRINVYRYKLDGNESFEAADKANVKELLEQYRIYYEEENGRITVPESDIPSAMVTRFYIKESSYFDQRSATYKTRVTALCPVLMEGDEFESVDNDGSSATPKPLFWVKYDDVATYLSRLPMMSSNLNNVTNMTADDYFTLNHYEGVIYKTNNMQGRVIPADSTRTREQKRIEQQLKDFEEHIWHASAPQDSLDSVAVAPAAEDPKASRKSRSKSENSSDTRRSKSSAAASKSRGSSAPRVSARRQRR
ncbi:MAG: gliding motility protein GldN [Bacteroidaceae bacterium]|nr:gliding motility protein GldN [Bacteroidaceae bacterium]